MAKDDSGLSQIEEYAKKLSHNPDSLVFVPLAEAYRKSGMLDEAVETCLKGLQLHPTYMSARMVLGRAYMEKSMLEEAATEFRKVASADVNNIMAHALLGQIYMQQRKHAEAVKEFQKVLALNPDDATAQQLLNQALEAARQNAPNTGAKPITGPEPGDKDRKQTLAKAEAFTEQGEFENAIHIYKAILEAEPDNLVVRQRVKDLEQKKNQTPAKPPGPGREPLRDNDKITSDDILSVMKDTGIARPGNASKTAEAQPKPIEPASKPAEAALKPVEAAPPSAAAGNESLPGLGKLMQADGILGAMLMDLQGTVLVSEFKAKNNFDLKQIGAAVGIIVAKTEKSVQAMNYGAQVKQILITGEKSQIIFHKVGTKILLVLADENINLGKMRLAMSEIVKALR